MPEAITFTGLGTGLDTKKIVESLVKLQREKRIVPLENWKKEWEDKITALRELNTDLSSLYAKVKEMDTEEEFKVNAVSSSNSSVATATATSQAIKGSYELQVNQLAKAETEVHTVGEASPTTIINNSGTTLTFKYSYGSNPVTTVNVPDGTTLQGLRDLINNDPSNPGVSASILFDGSAYHLKLTGNDTGASNQIIVDPNNDATLTGYTNGTFTQTQAAQNAQLRLDGYPNPGWIERSTNTITDLIEGLNISLLSTGTTTLTVSLDISAIEENLTEFLEAYNQVVKKIRDLSYYDPQTQTAGILSGNYALQIINSRLKSIILNTPPGFSTDTDTYSNLTQIGFYTDISETSDTRGQLKLDMTKFSQAINSHPEAVLDLLSATFKGITTDSNITYHGRTTNSEPGIYDIEVDIDSNQGRFRPAGEDWHPWVTLEYSGGYYYLTGQVGYPEEGIALRISYTSGTHTTTLRLKNGVIGELSRDLKKLTSIESGPINILIENYEDIINNIESKIEREEDRLELYEKMLTVKYAKLEEYLSDSESTQNYLSQFVSQKQTK